MIVITLKGKHLELELKKLKNLLAKQEEYCTRNVSRENGTIFKPVTSCSMLPESSPSGYYIILSSNGSTIRMFCDMKKTCGNITGGWMRVTNLDMRQASSKCPSSLCLDTSDRHPRTCRRCFDYKTHSVPSELFHVGVTYTHVCGKIKAYQVGTTDGYGSLISNIYDGISFSYGCREILI